MSQLQYWLARHPERGAAMVEYGLILTLIAIVSLLVVGVLGGGVYGLFDTGQLEFPATGGPRLPSS